MGPSKRQGNTHTLHADDVLPSCDQACHFDGCFDSLRARVPKVERVQRGVGHDWKKLLDETEVREMKGNAALKRYQNRRVGEH